MSESYVDYATFANNKKTETPEDREVKRVTKKALKALSIFLLVYATHETVRLVSDIFWNDWRAAPFFRNPSRRNVWCFDIGENFTLNRELTNDDKLKLLELMKDDKKSKFEALREMRVI